MRRSDVRTEADALAYIVDCTLATVSSLAMRKKPPSGEFKRQIEIAQAGINWMRDMHVNPTGTRALDVFNDYGGRVAEWAAQYRPVP